MWKKKFCLACDIPLKQVPKKLNVLLFHLESRAETRRVGKQDKNSICSNTCGSIERKFSVHLWIKVEEDQVYGMGNCNFKKLSQFRLLCSFFSRLSKRSLSVCVQSLKGEQIFQSWRLFFLGFSPFLRVCGF